MTLVVDASIAVKWFVPESDSVAADALIDSGEALIAPDIVLIEAANAFWKITVRREMAAEQADAALAALANGVLSLHPSAGLVADALRLASSLEHPVYDCLYVALAEREGASLVTADERTYGTVRRSGVAIETLRLGDAVALTRGIER